MMESNLKTVRSDLSSLVKTAQDLFREATSTTGLKAEDLRNKGLDLLDAAMVKAHEMQTTALETGKDLADTADTYVQENPWRAIAISAGVGVVIGLMIARK